MRIYRLLAAVVGTAGIACSAATTPGGGSTTPPSVADVTISPPSVAAQVGKSVQLTATAKDSAGNVLTDRGVSWNSSDNTVADVSATGMVTGHAVGTAVIQATVEGKHASVSATISPVPIASITISPLGKTVTPGTPVQYSATARDATGNALSGRTFSWTSSNTAVATIAGSGLATTLSTGTTTIAAASEGVSSQTSLTVSATPPPPVTSVSVSLASNSLTVGQTTQATATLKDASGSVLTGRTVTWSSSNTAAATVNASGVVSAVGAGSANVIATSEGVTGQATVSVSVVPVASVTVTLNSSTLTAGQTTQAAAVTKDASGNVLTGRAITWSSSNTAVATVNGTGLVSAVAAGSATITATSEGKSGTASLSVNAVTTTVDTLFVDHFDSGALSDANRWQDIVGTGASIVSAASAGIMAPSGSQVLKLSGTGAAISHFVSTAATSPYEHLYLSFRMLRTSLYQSSNPGLRAGGIRGSTSQWGSYGVGYATTGSCPDDPNNVHQQEFMFAYVFNDPAAFALRTYTNWIGEVKLSQNPPTCGGNYATDPGSNPTATYYDMNFVPTVDAWHQYEIEVQLNSVGQANGWQRMWVDGVLKIAHLNVRYRTTSGMKLWAVTFDTGEMHGGSLYFDDVVVTTGRPQ